MGNFILAKLKFNLKKNSTQNVKLVRYLSFFYHSIFFIGLFLVIRKSNTYQHCWCHEIRPWASFVDGIVNSDASLFDAG
ncbi:MAG: hypothetical protein EBQ89_08360 [Alphaproteobacteria bacterium]|nr:hypothetical protein [Alphaproteobacteria bacterium]